MIHVNVCPDCGSEDSGHLLDPPSVCPHGYDRFVPVAYVPLDDVVNFLFGYADEHRSTQALWFASIIDKKFGEGRRDR